MSGCACVRVDHDFDICEGKGQRIVRATRHLRCSECGRWIRAGEDYEWTWWRDFYGTAHNHTCPKCLALRKHFFCGRWCMGMVISDLIEHFEYEGESICCYDGLPSIVMDHLERVVWPRMEDPEA